MWRHREWSPHAPQQTMLGFSHLRSPEDYRATSHFPVTASSSPLRGASAENRVQDRLFGWTVHPSIPSEESSSRTRIDVDPDTMVGSDSLVKVTRLESVVYWPLHDGSIHP